MWSLFPGAAGSGQVKVSKRPHQTDDEDQSTPPAKKPKTTSKYIYETLFQKGEGSNISVSALGQSWNLHIIYLKQSEYFNTYFKWHEKDEIEPNNILLDIPDERIDSLALNTVFGSLYCDDIVIAPDRAVNVLAAASLLQHRGLIQHCSEVMLSFLNSSTVTSYYTAAITYGLPELEKGCVQWLEHNLMIDTPTEILRGIEASLMTRLISSPDLAVIQVEMDIYQLLKKWLFVQLQSSEESDRNLNCEADFKHLMSYLNTLRKDSLSILESIDEKYMAVFEGVRLCHVITDFKCAATLENEHIIPRHWIANEYRAQWLRMLRVENSYDSGPTMEICSALQEHESRSVSDFKGGTNENIKRLYHAAMRCGRILEENKDFCWRWTGYNYGFDLIMTYDHQKHSIKITRNCCKQDVATSVSMKENRSVVCKVKVFTLKPDGALDLSHSSGWRHFELGKDNDKTIIQIQRLKRPRLNFRESKMFMVAYMIFCEPAETCFYLPKSLAIKKSILPTSHSSSLSNSSNIVPSDLHGNSR